MNSKPDYNSYTLEELLDVQNNIDKERYSERSKEVELAISNIMTGSKVYGQKEIGQKVDDQKVKVDFEKQQEGFKYSTFAPRFWASIVDGVVIVVFSMFISFLGTKAGGGFQTILGYVDVVQFAVYSIALHALYGQTIGKMALGVKVVNYKTENEITFKQALLRDCVPVIMLILLLIASLFVPIEEAGEAPEWLIYSMMIFGFAYFLWHLLEIITMLFNEKNRAIHDFIAGTVVIRT